MDFDFTEEQQLLKNSVEGLLADHYGFEQRLAILKEPEGWSRDMWRRYAELGLLALPFDEKYGGAGAGSVETMIVAEAFGRALVLEPYLATVILAGGALRLGGTEQQKSALLPAIAEGSLLMALAHAEKQARYNLADVATTARRDNEAWVIDGEKTLVLHGDVAEKLIVSARVSGERTSQDGLALFVVEAGASGVSRRGYRTVDGLRAAEISFSGVRAGRGSVVGEAGKAWPLIERVFDGGLAALAAEAVGAMQEMHDLTVEYLKTRKQFGVPIGTFQALQHRAVDMLVELEQAKSMAMLATMSVDAEDAAERRRAISQAKVQLGRSIRFVGQQAVQLHGGIGMTMEYKLGHFFKRTTAIDKTFGDVDHHLALLAAAA